MQICRRSNVILSDRHRAALAGWAAVLCCAAACALPARAQPTEAPDGTLIRRVDVQGLEAISEGFVRRTIKTREGQNFLRSQTEEDVRALLRTRKFLNVVATTSLEENQAVVVFLIQEKPRIVGVELEGNKRFEDRDLFELTPAAGDVLDAYAVSKGREDIIQKYQQKGYFYVDVEIDQRALSTENRVVYRINEGPRVKVRKIRFEGVRSFPEFRLRMKLQTESYIWLLRTGALDEDKAETDALTLLQFYRDEGFLDARVGYRLDFDEVSRTKLAVVFVVDEGPRYRIHDIVVAGNTIFPAERLRRDMVLGPGKFLRDETLQLDKKRVTDTYGEIGYVDVQVNTRYEFLEEPGVIDLHFDIAEGKLSRFGRLTIRGNAKTRDEVIRRELRFYPGEPYNTVEARRAEQRLTETTLFTKATITPLNDQDGYREALVEVEEADNIKFLIGFGVSTDNGVIGSVTLENRNFDLLDWPRTWGEFFRGQAFRGDGQRIRLQAEPGTEVSRFRIDFTEPYLFDLPVRYDSSVYLFQRGRDGYAEQRLGYVTSLSKRFHSGLLANWAIEGALRIEGISIDDLDPLVARDIYEVRGSSFLTGAKLSIVRDTTDSRMNPTEGKRFTLSWEQVGALGGAYSFGKPAVGQVWYIPLHTDIFDRRTVLALRADAAYIVDDAPMFERLYGGGFGSMRGFAYRGISPRQGVYENRVGGNFIVLTGGEISVPLYARAIRGVTFLDMGTVEKDFGITKWRAAAGLGLRITVDFFGPVPIVLDFGFPIASSDQDDTRVFNFAFGASF